MVVALVAQRALDGCFGGGESFLHVRYPLGECDDTKRKPAHPALCRVGGHSYQTVRLVGHGALVSQRRSHMTGTPGSAG